MPRKYNSSRNVTSITYWRKFAEHRFFYILMAGVFGFGIIAYFGMGQSGGGNRPTREAQAQQTVATVNGEPITRIQYEKQVEQYKRYMGGGGELQSLQMQGMVLTGLIDQATARSAAKARGLRVSDAEVDKGIADFKKQVSGGKGMSDQEFQERLQLMGMTEAELRDQERENLLPKVLTDDLTKGVKSSEADLVKSYNEVKLRHILVSTSKLPEEQAKRKAEQILTEVKSGKDFAQLANKFTDDPGNQKPGKMDPKTKKAGKPEPQGGLYDWAPATKYVPEFTEAALALKPGEVSPPVKTPFGFHIIKLEGIRAKLPKDFEKDKAKLLDDFKRTEGQKVARKFMDDEKKKTKITWQDPSLEWRYEYAMSHPMMSMPQPEKPDFWPKLKAYAAKNTDDSAAAFVLGQQSYMQYVTAPKGTQKDRLRKEVIGYYDAALKHSEDQQTRLTLAQLYREDNNDAAALQQYQKMQRMLGWEEGTQTKPTHLQLEKAFKEMGHPELAEKETKKIALLTVQEKKEAEERKKQDEEAKKAAAANKNKGAAPGTLNVGPGGKATTIIPTGKGATVAPGGSFTVEPDTKAPDKNPAASPKGKSTSTPTPPGK